MGQRIATKTIRYYEDIGLVRPARGTNGYRDFSDQEAHKLVFLGRSRSLGSRSTTVEPSCLYTRTVIASSDVKAIAAEHLGASRRKSTNSPKSTLEALTRCHGDDRADCPILNDLSGRAALSAGRALGELQMTSARLLHCISYAPPSDRRVRPLNNGS